jgi:hypothetical protein
MPYKIKKQKCTQSDGDKGEWVLTYTDKKGKKHKNCHTSKKKAHGQIAAIEMRSESLSYPEIAGRRTFFYNPSEEPGEEVFEDDEEFFEKNESLIRLVREIISNELYDE